MRGCAMPPASSKARETSNGRQCSQMKTSPNRAFIRPRAWRIAPFRSRPWACASRPALEQGGDERIGVADGIIGFLCRQRGGTSTRHEFLRPECAQGFQRGGLLLKKDQGRPGQAGDGFNPGKQAWESLDPGLHVLLAVLDDQVVCSPAGDDLLAALRENAEALSTRTA